jgi:threonyl-tRNA synthetase
VVGIPVADAFGDYLQDVVDQLVARGIRAEADHSDDRMQKKIRTHTTAKVPFLLLAGEKDVAAGAVSFRFRDGTQINGVPAAAAVQAIVDWVGQRRNDAPTAAAFEALRPAAAAPADGADG